MKGGDVESGRNQIILVVAGVEWKCSAPAPGATSTSSITSVSGHPWWLSAGSEQAVPNDIHSSVDAPSSHG